MDRSEEYRSLAAFTTLSPLAVGGLLGLLLTPEAQPGSGINWAAGVVWGAGFLALVASLFHLGRPWRAPLAVLHLGSSWLSREVTLFGLFLVLLGGYTLLPAMNLGGLALSLVGAAGVLIGLLGTIATGEAYRLHARPSWDQWLSVVAFPLGALSTGSLFGFFAARQFGERSEPAGYLWVAAAVLLIFALAVTWQRSARRRPESAEGDLSRQLALGAYRGWLVTRVAAVIAALILIGIGGGAQYLAWLPALLGEAADRVLFFKAVVPVTLRGRYVI